MSKLAAHINRLKSQDIFQTLHFVQKKFFKQTTFLYEFLKKLPEKRG